MIELSVPVDEIISKASFWRVEDDNNYVAIVDTGFNEYVKITFKRDELVKQYGSLIDSLDVNYALLNDSAKQGNGLHAAHLQMLQAHLEKQPLSFTDANGVLQYVYEIYEFDGMDSESDLVMTCLNGYTLAASNDGIPYVDTFSERYVNLPISLLEEHYPLCRGRLKTAFGLGMKEELSDAEIVAFVCESTPQTQYEHKKTQPEQLPSDLVLSESL